MILGQQHFLILKFPNLEFTVIYLCDRRYEDTKIEDTKAIKLLVEGHYFMMGYFARANRSLLQLCHPSAWIKLSSSECTSIYKALGRQNFGVGILFGF